MLPFFNEVPELFRACLESIEGQSRLPDRVWIVDDGSSSPCCAEVARQWCRRHEDGPMEVRLHVLSDNLGKRAALGRVFRADAEADIFFTVDSDTRLDERAMEEGLRPFEDPEVTAVAGTLSGHNRESRLLTEVIDVEFTTTFLVNRAFQSGFGSVLVTCGSLAAYRGELCRRHVDDLTEERFLGRRVSNGDDRRLTQLALLRGRVVQQLSCRGEVALPESLGHLFRQRLRWSTSLLRGSLWMLGKMPISKPSFWLSLLQSLWLVGQSLLIVSLPFAVSSFGLVAPAGLVLALTVPGVLIRASRYRKSREVLRRSIGAGRALVLSVLSSALGIVVLIPARWLAVLFLRNSAWLTRRGLEPIARVSENESRADA